MSSITVRNDYHQLVRHDAIGYLPETGGTLLDVGGGVGATAVAAKAAGKAARAGVVDLVSNDHKAEGLDFRYCGNLEDQNLLHAIVDEQGPFDTILCLDILEHLSNPWSMVASLHQALRPGGVIVASIPNVRHYTVLLPLLFSGRWTLSDSGILDRTHLRFFVRRTAIELMTSSGLTLDYVASTKSSIGRIKWFERFTAGLFRDFTSLQYIIRVKRSN